MQWIINTSEQMEQFGFTFGLWFLKHYKTGIICLDGELGCGKTTFTKGFAKALGIKKTVKSPTYTYLLEYDTLPPFIHVDAYRLSNTVEFDYSILDETICLIEWSKNIKDNLPTNTINFTFEYFENKRKVKLQGEYDDFNYFNN